MAVVARKQCGRTEFYEDYTKSEYLEDLKRVFKSDYARDFSNEELEEVSRNLDAFLGALN